jgi:hypothetical protein
MPQEYLAESLCELRKLVEHIIVLQGDVAPQLAARKIAGTGTVERKARELDRLIENQFEAYRETELRRASAR